MVVWECELKDEAALRARLAAFLDDQGMRIVNE